MRERALWMRLPGSRDENETILERKQLQPIRRRKTALLSAAGWVVAVLLFAPGHAGASSGSIAGGTGDPSTRTGHVDNLTATLDACDTCAEQGVFAKVESEEYGCPLGSSVLFDEPAAFWGADVPTTGGTVQSGPQNFEYFETLVCLYAVRNEVLYNAVDLLASKPLVFNGKPDGDNALKHCKKKRSKKSAQVAKKKKCKKKKHH